MWKEPKLTHCKTWVQKSRLEPGILRWLLDFWKACEPLFYDTSLAFPEETEEKIEILSQIWRNPGRDSNCKWVQEC
jgi:hypothetical protein